MTKGSQGTPEQIKMAEGMMDSHQECDSYHRERYHENQTDVKDRMIMEKLNTEFINAIKLLESINIDRETIQMSGAQKYAVEIARKQIKASIKLIKEVNLLFEENIAGLPEK